MPELPEVETTRRGIVDLVENKTIIDLAVLEPRLRWPVPADLSSHLVGQTVRRVVRRGKYLLFYLDHGYFIFHLGMSGSLRVYRVIPPRQKHDHVDIYLTNGDAAVVRENINSDDQDRWVLRFRDPRRFGALLWQSDIDVLHPLLASLGPEPFDASFDAEYLHKALGRKNCAIKLALMDNHVVVGVGNIYANESLFSASIAPQRPASELSLQDCTKLVSAVQDILQKAIQAGGSTLRDFVDADGKPGYFQQQYAVYGRADQTCAECGELIRHARLGQRSTFWCPVCQRR